MLVDRKYRVEFEIFHASETVSFNASVAAIGCVSFVERQPRLNNRTEFSKIYYLPTREINYTTRVKSTYTNKPVAEIIRVRFWLLAPRKAFRISEEDNYKTFKRRVRQEGLQSEPLFSQQGRQMLLCIPTLLIILMLCIEKVKVTN